MAGAAPRSRRDVSNSGPRGPEGVGDPAPLIVTAELPPDLHRWATRLRASHFPPERNFLEAHVTLFHALPAQVEAELSGLLGRWAGSTPPVPARLEGVMSLGRGTALRLTSPAMLALRERIAEHFHGMLTAQDSHAPRLHITIQNKVSAEVAEALQASLRGTIAPRDFVFRGLTIHRYRNGPWEPVRRVSFRGRKG